MTFRSSKGSFLVRVLGAGAVRFEPDEDGEIFAWSDLRYECLNLHASPMAQFPFLHCQHMHVRESDNVGGFRNLCPECGRGGAMGSL